MTYEQSLGETIIEWWPTFSGPLRMHEPDHVADCMRALKTDWRAFLAVSFFRKGEIWNILDHGDADELLEAVANSKYVPALMKKRIAEAAANPPPHPRRDIPPPTGYLYLIFHGRTKLIKIGFSKNPKAREKTLQAEDPDLKIIYMAEATMHDERHFHQFFREQRRRGEWFDLTEDDVQIIKDEFEL